MLRTLVCAGSIVAAAAASPSVTIGVVVNDPVNLQWIDRWQLGQNGGSLTGGGFFSSGNKAVVFGTFSTIFATEESGSSVLNVFDDGDLLNPIDSIPVNGLSHTGTSANNVFILELDAGGASMTFRNMNGGISGKVSALNVWEVNDKILVVGDFGHSTLNYMDFRIWDIGNVAWDTYTMRLSGYDGYWPDHIDQDGTDTFKVRLSTVANAYGGYTDNDGWESFPWTTQWVYWDISLQRWTGYE